MTASPSAHSPTWSTVTTPPMEGQSLYNLLYFCRDRQIVCFYRPADPKRKTQSYSHPSVSFQKHQLCKSLLFSCGDHGGGESRNTSAQELPPHRIKCFLLTAWKEESHGHGSYSITLEWIITCTMYVGIFSIHVHLYVYHPRIRKELTL